MAKHWASMEPADPEVVIQSIIGPGCLHLWQDVTHEGPEVVDPVMEVPDAWTFIQKLPKKVRRKGDNHFDFQSHVWSSHSSINNSSTVQFPGQDHQPWNTAHYDICHHQNISPAQLTREVPEHHGRPSSPPTSEEQCMAKVEKTILPWHDTACMSHEPWNGPTHILAATVWLKLWWKFFNQGTAKEACKLFWVRAKQLSKVITGKKYLGGTKKKGPLDQGVKRKRSRSKMAMKEPEDDDDDDKNTNCQKVKDRLHWKDSDTPTTKDQHTALALFHSLFICSWMHSSHH